MDTDKFLDRKKELAIISKKKISPTYKNNQIDKDTAIVIVDSIASSIPLLNLAWGLSKTYYGAGLKLRQKKALEWVEMIRDNSDIFVKKLLKNEKFQDGFVYALEYYIRERNERKRVIMRQAFKEFSTNIDNDFDLEKTYFVLNILSLSDLSILRKIDFNKNVFFQIYGNNNFNLDGIYNLINAGILMSDYSSRIGQLKAPFIKVTNFGRVFSKLVLE